MDGCPVYLAKLLFMERHLILSEWTGLSPD